MSLQSRRLLRAQLVIYFKPRCCLAPEKAQTVENKACNKENKIATVRGKIRFPLQQLLQNITSFYVHI